MSDIKPGYAIEVTTWENDADHCNTVRFDGLTSNGAKFLLEVANLFKYESSRNQDDIRALVRDYRNKYRDIPEGWDPATWDEPVALEDAEFSCGLYDLIGIDNYGGEYRYFERASIYYIPKTLEDITHLFQEP